MTIFILVKSNQTEIYFKLIELISQITKNTFKTIKVKKRFLYEIFNKFIEKKYWKKYFSSACLVIEKYRILIFLTHPFNATQYLSLKIFFLAFFLNMFYYERSTKLYQLFYMNTKNYGRFLQNTKTWFFQKKLGLKSFMEAGPQMVFT